MHYQLHRLDFQGIIFSFNCLYLRSSFDIAIRMSTSSLSDKTEELTFENIETLLQQDEGLVEFFNSFLALPCFAERLFYNSDINLFEEFLERIADDEDRGDAKAATHLRKGTLYNGNDNKSRIGYYVTVLDKVQGLEFIKKYRLPLFTRSELYAEYKLSKHLSAMQGSFSRGLFCDGSDGEDSGVEEAYIRRNVEGARRHSVVSFNLSPSLGGTGSTDDESEFDDEFYLSPHFRSVEETLDAWHESFTRPGSRMTPLPSREEDDFWDSRSSSSCFSAQESGTNSGRPVSRLSFVSDSSDKGFTAALGSRLGSASSTEVTRENGSEDAFRHDNMIISSEQQHGDTVRSTTSALSFVEHIEVKNASSAPVKSDDNAIIERVDQFLTREGKSIAEIGRDAIEKIPLENELIEALEGAEGADDEIMHYFPNPNEYGNEINFNTNGCRPNVPHITETTFVDDNEGLEGKSRLIHITVQSPAVNQNDEDFKATEYEIVERVDEVNEQLSKVTEEFCSSKDGLSLSEHVEEDFLPSKSTTEDQMKKEEKMPCCSWNEKDMADCSHCPSLRPYQEGSVIECSEGSSENTRVANQPTERQESRERSRRIELVSGKDECNIIETANKAEVDVDPLKLTSDASGEVTPGKKGDEDYAMSAAEKENAFEHGRVVDRMVEDKEGDDEGGYTTEASASSLQGIRGIFSGRRRESTVATSVAHDIDEESAYSDDASEVEEKPYDLCTKSAFDAFKEFLLGTSAEKLLQFWLEVECGRYLASDHEKARLVQSLRDRFFKSGGIYEFSSGAKSSLDMRDASKLTYDSLYNIQPHILGPLLSYWCIRFTMHQQRSSHSQDLDYKRLVNERPKSCVRREDMLSNLPQVPTHTGLAHVLPKTPLTRPQSSGMCKKTTQYQTSRPQIRAKSAHPRLIQAPKLIHTNASSKQLQNVMAPVRMGYGFEQVPGPSFPVEPEPDYLCSVRLFINPVPSPDSRMQRILRTLHRTSVTPSSSKSGCLEETEPDTDVMLESLIQGLIYERQTGNYFEQFLQNSGNETWMNCLAFWKSLQEYNAYFYADSLKPSVLSRKARTMFANFIAPGSCHEIPVSRDIQTQVHRELEPPYEELFDAVEEHVLYSLLEPWNMLLNQEKQVFSCEVSKEQSLRHLEIKAMARSRQSVANTHGGLDSVDDDQEKERISVEEANRPLSVPKDGFTFETLIKNREEVEHFKEFLGKKHTKGIKDLKAWTDMETFRRVPGLMEDKRDKKAREIRDSWLGKKYFFGQDSPATREGRNLIMNLNGGRPIKERPSSPVIIESQKFVRARIERRWLRLFKQTAEFLERQKSHSAGIPEMVEDIMLKRRLQRSEAAWKILNSRWVSSSRDVVALRQTLLNPDSCAEFSAFVAIKGDTLESNVQFWLEVQKFKDLCHAHAQPALVHRKIQTIIDCFLNSAISPELQIDIPIEMADKLMERLSSRNTLVHPYVFREAQMTVFRVLFNHWKEFLTYRSKIPEGENPQEHFQEQLRRHRTDIKSKKEASERRRMARLSAERKKKEKEEREKRRIEDLASLFSMEPASIFYSEEDDSRSWFYSKHLVELERQEHIKRLREQGITFPEEHCTEEKEDARSRRSRFSLAKSSTFTKVRDSRKVNDGGSEKRSSEDSSRRLQAKLQTNLSPPSVRRGSAVSTGQSATTHRNSGISVTLPGKETRKDGNNANKQGEHKVVSTKDILLDKKSGRKTSEIQVIPIAPSEIREPGEADRWQNKLLPQRTRSSKQLLTTKQQPTSAEKKRVPLDAISCVSDYSVFSNIEFVPRTVAPRKHGRQGDFSLLTSKSLRDFTNSPEGAQLSMPLPLVRISSASHLDKSDTEGSLRDPSPLNLKPRPLTQSLRKATIWSAKQKGLHREEMKLKPDVIVN